MEKKLCIFTGFILPHLGGVERYTDKLVDQLEKMGYFITIVTTNFDNDKNYYIKQDVLESIEEIKNPVCLSEAENNNQGILTIIELIDEKIRHIDEAIEKLEKYQENFITKCFEKAETIVRDLEKLPGLSKIKFGGKDINIIKLELFEYEKDEKIRRMKEYIYKMVQDMEEKPEEMTKEVLNEKLSSKMLVGQIINIDKAYVKLYKMMYKGSI